MAGWNEKGTYSTVGLIVGIRSFGFRSGRIVAEGRKRVTVEVRFKAGHTRRKTVSIADVTIGHGIADILTKDLTAIGSFRELVDAKGGYRPTIYPKFIGHRMLIKAYDEFQAKRGDSRRVHQGLR